MAITRDPDFPADIAALVQSFNVMAGGHSTLTVLEASANMLIAAIGHHARANGATEEQAVAMATQMGIDLPKHVAVQWSRLSQATDIEVLHG